MAYVFCIASPKGGSGKTILTASIGKLLAASGISVLMIDTDAATNGLTLMFLEQLFGANAAGKEAGLEPRGVYEAPEVGVRIVAAEIEPNLEMLPTTYVFQNTEGIPPIRYERYLRETIRRAHDKYDVIILDAQAGTDIYAVIAMKPGISDVIVIVAEYDPISAAGVERMKAIMRDYLTYERTWVLLNKMLPEFVRSYTDFLEWSKYLPPITWDADVVRAYATKRIPIDLESGSEFTTRVIGVLRLLLPGKLKPRFEEWLTKLAEVVRQPISVQLTETETQLRRLKEMEIHIKRREDRKKYISRVASLGIGVGLTLGMLIPFAYLLSETKYFVITTKQLIPVVIVAIAGIATIAFASVIIPVLRDMIIARSKTSDADIDMILERSEILRERLKRLEALKAADIATLFSSNRKIS